MGSGDASRHRGAGPQNDEPAGKTGAAALKAFLSKAKAATARAAQGLGGASALGAYLAEDAVDATAGAEYSPRTLSDHRDRQKRTISVRVMGAEGPSGHEVWLTVWSRSASEVIAAVERSARRSGWEALGEVSGKVLRVRGPVELACAPSEGTVSLVYRERRDKPFSSAEFAAHLEELFAEMEKLLSADTAAAEGAAAGGHAALPELGPGDVYDGPEALVAALSSGRASLGERKLRLRIASCEAAISVAESPKGKKIELDLEASAPPPVGALAWSRQELGDPSFSVRGLGERTFSIRRTVRSGPALAEIRQTLDYAVRFLGKLGEYATAAAARSSGLSSAGAEVGAPGGTESVAAEEKETAAASAQAENRPAAGGEIVEEEEVSLDELLAGAADEKTSAGPAPEQPAVAPPPPVAKPPAEAAPGPAGADAAEVPPVPAAPAPVAVVSPAPSAGEARVTATRPPAARAEPVPDTPFGNFRAVEKIGRDVLGVLYKAHDPQGQTVALKVLDREHTLDPVFARRFVRETWPAAKLSHPALKRVLASGRTKDQVFYYASEFVEGLSAKQTVESGRVFEPAELVRVARTLAEALEYAHSKGVFHGDVRPSLVLLASDGSVKLAETGVARDFWGAIDRLLSHQGWVISDARTKKDAREALETIVRERSVSLWFLAPELAAPRSVPDARTDVYGLGATLYFMATGRVPFEGASALELLSGEQGAAAPAHELAPRVPRELGAVIAKMMAPGSVDRYQSMGEVLAALAALRPPSTGPR